MGRRKFLLRRYPAECGKEGDAIVVTLLVPRVPQEVTALPLRSVCVRACARSTMSLQSCMQKKNFL